MKRLYVQLILLLALCTVCGGAWANTQVDTQTLKLSFSEQGRLDRAFACFPACSGEGARVQQFGNHDIVSFHGLPENGWQLEQQAKDGSRRLQFTHPGGALIAWTIPAQGYRLGLEIRGASGLELRSGESFRPRESAGFGTWLEQSRYVVFHQGDVNQLGFEEELEEAVLADRWAGYRNRFWALLADSAGERELKLVTGEGREDGELTLPFTGGEPHMTSVYLGPIEPRVLAQADPALSDLLFSGLWFWLRWICFGLFYLLSALMGFIPVAGLAVMVLSVCVGLLMTPLSRIADRLQEEVHEIEARLAPEMQRIKQNYKGEEQSARILALYEKEKVHPLYSLKSLAGVAVVIPVFIGAFDMLAENIHLLNVGFLWIADLSRPDSIFSLPFRLPFFGADVNLLPFLMTGLSVIASALHNPPALDPGLRRKQVRNMVFMAIGFFALFYTFPAGMVLYWTTNNLISVIKSLWARR